MQPSENKVFIIIIINIILVLVKYRSILECTKCNIFVVIIALITVYNYNSTYWNSQLHTNLLEMIILNVSFCWH